MRQASHTFTVETRGQGLVEITRPVTRWVEAQGMTTGLLTVFCRHTSASLLIQENADPDVRTDLEAYFAAVAPEDPGRYIHGSEGPDDMPAHIRTALTQVSLGDPRSPADASSSAPGRASICSSIAAGRTGARSRSTSSASSRANEDDRCCPIPAQRTSPR